MSFNSVQFCEKCGAQLTAGSKFCEKCGRAVQHEVYTEKTETPTQQSYYTEMPTRAMYEQNDIYSEEEKKTNTGTVVAIIVLAVVLVLVIAVSAVLIFGDNIGGGNIFGGGPDAEPTEAVVENDGKILFNPFEKISVKFYGENGKGYAQIIVNDTSNGLDVSYFTVQNNGNLKNGDNVTVVFDKDTFVTYHSEYDVRTLSSQYTVISLTDAEVHNSVVNPFEFVDIYFSGANGSGFAHISTISEEFSTVYYYLEGTNGALKNGDVITVRFDKSQFNVYHPGYTFVKDSHTYVVSGLEGTAVTPRPTDDTLPYDLRVAGSANGYILPYSNIQYYDEAFLSTLTDKQLKFARNEITARHGRKFVTVELQQYFETTSWYVAKYEPTYFDDHIFGTMNEFEKGNMEIIKKIEQARKAN